MEELLGTSLAVTIAVTIIVMGSAAFMSGQAVARGWQPLWRVLPYALLLGAGDRFLIFALFDGDLFLVTGYLVDTAWLYLVALTAYRLTRARLMVRQYPWAYERAGLFAWRDRSS